MSIRNWSVVNSARVRSVWAGDRRSGLRLSYRHKAMTPFSAALVG